MPAYQSHGINGHADALSFERGVEELRRGRAVQVRDGDRGLLFAAIEPLRGPLLARLSRSADSGLRLYLTGERALAAGLSDDRHRSLAVRLTTSTPLETLRAIAGIGLDAAVDAAAIEVDRTLRDDSLVTAALQLTKGGRLVPAVIGFPTNGEEVPGVLAVDAKIVARQASSFRHHSLELVSRARVPLADAVDTEIALFRDEHSLAEHVAVVIGNPNAAEAVPVRLHSACLTGDLLASLRCDCGEQLRTAVARIATLGGGVLLYLDQEGRGIGLPNKLRAYVLQDGGLDTVDADRHLGFLADERSYEVAAALLRAIGFEKVRLLTNNPQKINALREHGIDVVGRVPLLASTNAHNERYLRAKQERAGHLAEESSG